jgi:hypothetical protein
MVFKFFHQNTISALIIAPLILLGLWLRVYIIDIVHITTLDNPSMPLWDSIILPYLGYSGFTAATGSLTLALLTGLRINRMVSKYGLLHSQSMLSLIIFGLLSSAFLSVQKLNPVWFFVFFFVLGIERLFGSVTKKHPASGCFDAALLMGLGSLIFAKGLFFFPILLTIMGILRLANVKSVIASILGLSFPFVVSFVWFFINDQELWFLQELNENLIANPGQYNHTVFSQIYMGIIIATLALSIIVTMRHISAQKIIVRFYFRCFIWILLITGAAVLTPFFSMELIPVAAAGASVVVASWLEKIKSGWIQESLFFVLIAVTLAGQLLLY